MNHADPEPGLTPEESALADGLRARVSPAAAPADFAARLRQLAAQPKAPPAPAPAPPGRRIRIAFGFAAVAAAAAVLVAAAWVAGYFGQSDPGQPSVAAGSPQGSAGQGSKGSPASEPPPQDAAPPLAASATDADAGQFLAVREVALVRRDRGLPPVQFLAVDGLRVTGEGSDRQIEVETRFVPVILEYH
ncbi:MAG: hypothetical protein R3F11_15095 [Verrucomicrobiales bacterium]